MGKSQIAQELWKGSWNYWQTSGTLDIALGSYSDEFLLLILPYLKTLNHLLCISYFEIADVLAEISCTQNKAATYQNVSDAYTHEEACFKNKVYISHASHFVLLSAIEMPT